MAEVEILLSGGLDSAACVEFYHQQKRTVLGIHFQYGQAAAAMEKKAARAIARHYNVKFRCLTLSGAHRKRDGVVHGRNAFLLSAALMEAESATRTIAIGIHSGTPYADCSSKFIREMQALFDLHRQGTLRIGAPFQKWNKQDIWEFCKTNTVPIELTYSCERGAPSGCARCASCRDRKTLYACA